MLSSAVRHLLNIATYAELDVASGRPLRLAPAGKYTVASLRGAYGLACTSVLGQLVTAPVSVSAERALAALPVLGVAAGEVTGEVRPDALVLRVGRRHLELKRLPEEPGDPVAEAQEALSHPAVLSVPMQRWRDAFGRAVQFVATDYAQPTLTGVHVYAEDGVLMMEASNGYSLLYRESVGGATTFGLLDEILVPGGERQYRHLNRDGSDGTLRFTRDEGGRLFARGPGSAFHWPRLSGTAPTFALPGEWQGEGYVRLPDTRALVAAREAIGGAATITLTPAHEMGPEVVRLSFDQSDAGHYEEELTGRLPGPRRLFADSLTAIAKVIPSGRLDFMGSLASSYHVADEGRREAYALLLPA